MSDASRRRLAAVPDTPPEGKGRAAARRTGKPTTTTPIPDSYESTGPAAAAGGAHGPYSKRPSGPALLGAERTPLMAEALKGVRLGAYDRKALDWLCRWADTPTFLSLLGILERTRQLAGDPTTAAAGEGKDR